MRNVIVCSILAIVSLNAYCEDAPKTLGSVAKVNDLLAVVKNTKAKVILLNFWGITCSPCIAEMPALTRASERFKDNPSVAFQGICVPADNTAKEKIVASATEIIHQRRVTYRNMVWSGTGEALLEKFDIQGTPYTILVSSEGKQLSEIKVPLDPDKAVDLIEKSIAKALETDGAVEVKK